MGERCGVSLKGLQAGDMLPSRHMRRNDTQPCTPVTITTSRHSDGRPRKYMRCTGTSAAEPVSGGLSMRTGTIIASVVGGVCGVALLWAGICLFTRHADAAPDGAPTQPACQYLFTHVPCSPALHASAKSCWRPLVCSTRAAGNPALLH